LPLVEPDELGAFYPDDYTAHERPRGQFSAWSATLLSRTRHWRGLRRPPLVALSELRPGRVLDVGSGRGDLAVVLDQKGWRVTGVEPSEAACIDARRRGLEFECGTLADVAVRLDPGYDAVVFQHSLEHVTEPLEDLARTRKLLRSGGILLISVPNFDCWQRKRFGSSWFHLDLPRHRSHFSAAGLDRLVRRVGFQPIGLTTSTNADGLPMSVLYRVLGRRRFTEGPSLYAIVGISLMLAPVSATLNGVAGAGDVLHVVAAKDGGA
jgi:SAM-dependent methyltransferase